MLLINETSVNEDRLYRVMDEIHPLKENLEKHLKAKWETLFDAGFDLMLYDVTSIYFEGEAKANPQAQRGYSRDHRPDCKQVCLGLVVTREGLPVGYDIFAGNTHDSKTVETIVTTMETRYGKTNRIWVWDRGMLHAKFFEITTQADPQQKSGVSLRWTRNQDHAAETTEGCYLLRTNIPDWSASDIWQLYIQLTHVEAAFRVHKSQLEIRPVYHQKEQRVQAHILVCFLTYALWKLLEQWQAQAGLGNSPRTILDELGQIQSADVVLPTETGERVRLRCVIRPEKHQQILLQRLGLQIPQRMSLPQGVKM